MKKVRYAAGLVSALMLISAGTQAEEVRRGDYIYVPASVDPEATGMYTLRVEGICSGTERESEKKALADAEFGVYVKTEDGNYRAWANPLYPLEPMRIRTGNDAVHFSLPSGIDFYLRQESAPEGFLFDSETLIPVDGTDIVVTNKEKGELQITVCDSLGTPLQGATVSIEDGEGSETDLVTDANGTAVYSVVTDGVYKVREKSVPEGCYPVLHTIADGNEAAEDSVTLEAGPAKLNTISFVHPAVGTVQLDMQLSKIQDDGSIIAVPLAGVTMSADNGFSLTTDQYGHAEGTLIEGTYNVSFSCPGQDGIVLPVQNGQMVIQSGNATVISLTATENSGRLQIQLDHPEANVAVSLKNSENGDVYGPYQTDSQGRIISEDLPYGSYMLTFSIPDGYELGDVRLEKDDSSVSSDTFSVEAGQLCSIEVSLLTMENSDIEAVIREIGDDGSYREQMMKEAVPVKLLDSDGNIAAETTLKNGSANLTALGGTYSLLMNEADAEKLGILAESLPFSIPSEDTDRIVFPVLQARLIVRSLDKDGAGIQGTQYQITDADGNSQIAITGANGEAVSSLLPSGTTQVTTYAAAEGFDVSKAQSVDLPAGQAFELDIRHEAYGKVLLSVENQSLDDLAKPVLKPAPGKAINAGYYDSNGEISDIQEYTADEDGCVTLKLPSGKYAAWLEGEEKHDFEVQNETEISVQLTSYEELGGVRVHVNGEGLDNSALAQMRFELVNAEDESQTFNLSLKDGIFIVSSLQLGEYTLKETRSPAGMPPISDKTILVESGKATEITVSTDESAKLSVSKVGLAFNKDLKTYLVPLSGSYAVYTACENGNLKAYPDEENQLILWANVSLTDSTKQTEAILPAEQDGTKYYLVESSASDGFVQDAETHEICLYPGDDVCPVFSVPSDRGFFELDAVDAESGTHLSGGKYCLINANGEEVLSFTLGDSVYTNEMSLPVGNYTLRQESSPEGYALAEAPEQMIEIKSYTSGEAQARLSMACRKIPDNGELQTGDFSVWLSEENGVSLIGVDTGKIETKQQLMNPALTFEIGSEDGRTNISGLTICPASDSSGNKYAAYVEYALKDGGWQPSEAVLLDSSETAASVSFSSVKGDIHAVRITYLNAESGKEITAEGFEPGIVTVNVQTENTEQHLNVNAALSGNCLYQTQLSGESQVMQVSAAVQQVLVLHDGIGFGMESGGNDGRITGFAFIDENGDGILENGENKRYAGMTVQLLDDRDEIVDACPTGSDGTYSFANLTPGSYHLEFQGGDSAVFTHNLLVSEHTGSRVTDQKSGKTDSVVISAEQNDYVILAGCMYASRITGTVAADIQGEMSGIGGASVELHRKNEGADEEPVVTSTDDGGNFSFAGLLPGDYLVRTIVPSGYLSADSQDGMISREVSTSQGNTEDIGNFDLIVASNISGAVLSDDQNASAIKGIRVILLKAQGDQMTPAAETQTASDGSYVFDNVYPGTYCVEFELHDGYAFTAYGDDSSVFGAAGQVGTTQNFEVEAGSHTEKNAGITLPAALHVLAFKDTQGDGIKGNYDTWLEGVQLVLIRIENGQEGEALSGTTDENGECTFEGVCPGTFILSYEMPDQWRSTKQVSAADGTLASQVPQTSSRTGRSEAFALLSGDDRQMVIGALLSGSISGTVFYDANADGIRSDSEEMVSGLTVELLNAAGETVAETITDSDGNYLFEGLSAAKYHVRFHAEEGCGFAGTEKSAVRGAIAETKENTADTREISLTSGLKAENVNAAVVRLASISGSVWEDADANGEPEDTEKRLAGIQVDLFSENGRTVLASVSTNEEGHYSFDSLMPGNYKLRIMLKDNYVFDAGTSGLETTRGNYGYSSAITVSAGDSSENNDFGMMILGIISGNVWQDDNYNGILDPAEPGLRSASVTLLGISGEVVSQVRSGRNGEFSFDKLLPGQYSIQIELPQGYVFTKGDSESIAARSNESSATIMLDELSMGQEMGNLRIGALKPSAYSGVVWYDADNDGRRSVGETGIASVKVTLAVLEGTDAGQILETETDNTGLYTLSAIMPGTVQLTYHLGEGQAFAVNASGRSRVSVVPETDATEASTEKLTVSSGADRNDLDVGVVSVGTVSGHIWNDADYNGQDDSDNSGISGATVNLVNSVSGETVRTAQTDDQGIYRFNFVRLGDYRVEVRLPEQMMFTKDGTIFRQTDDIVQTTDPFHLNMGEGRENLNAGAIASAALSGCVQIASSGAGVSGTVVSLLEGGTVIQTVQTDAGGKYTLNRLRPGDYRIRYTLPENVLFTEDCWLTTSGKDALEGETPVFNLKTGDSLEVKTVQLVKGAAVSGHAWSDADANGLLSTEEEALIGTEVNLLNSSGEVLKTVTVNENGNYSFSRLRAGDYALQFTLPADTLFADHMDDINGSCIIPTDNNAAATEIFHLSEGESRVQMNVGGIRAGIIGDTIWLDENGNGLQDYREEQLSGVHLILLKVTEDGQTEKTLEAESDQYGYYHFEALRPGQYKLKVVMETGDELTVRFDGSLGEIDSDINPDTQESDVLYLRSGETLLNVDVGFKKHEGK